MFASSISTTSLLLVVLALSAGASTAVARSRSDPPRGSRSATAPEAGPPSEPPATVTISLDTYQAIFERAYLQEKRRDLENEYSNKAKELADAFSAKTKKVERDRAQLAATEKRLKETANKARRAAEQRTRLMGSDNFTILNHTVSAEIISGQASFDHILDLQIFEDAWTSIPIITTEIIATDLKVGFSSRSPQHAARNVTSEMGASMPRLLTHVQTSGPVNTEKDFRVLVADKAGFYRVKLRTYQPVRVEKKINALPLTLLYPIDGIKLRILTSTTTPNTPTTTNTNINTTTPANNETTSTTAAPIERPSIHDLSVEPIGRTTLAAHSSKTSSGTIHHYTDVDVRLPLTSQVQFKWRVSSGDRAEGGGSGSSSGRSGSNRPPAGLAVDENDGAHHSTTLRGSRHRTSASNNDNTDDDDDDDDDDEPEPTATVVHDALHIVSDGLLQSTHSFTYALDVGMSSVPDLDLVVRGKARVTGVTGHGVQSWRAIPLASNSTTVRISFKSSLMSETINLLMTTETETEAGDGATINGDISSSVAMTLPTIQCLNVLRQTGTFGVVKASGNVELYEHSSKGVARAAMLDLPESMRFRAAGQPIVLAYKYLSPQHTVKISQVRHHEEEVIEAVVEQAAFEKLVLDKQTMSTFTLTMQNTNTQYLKLSGIPRDALLWDLLVNSVPTKAVKGINGTLMVPLLVGRSGLNDGRAEATSVELSYLSTHRPLGPNGTLDLSPPSLDIPIAALSIEARLPSRARYNFTQPQVRKFSQSAPVIISNDVGSQVTRTGHPFGFKTKLDKDSPFSPSDKHGVPKAGTAYRFEKLLVLGGDAGLMASYQKIPPKSQAASNDTTVGQWIVDMLAFAFTRSTSLLSWW